MEYKKNIVKIIIPLTLNSCIPYSNLNQEITEICPGLNSNSKIEIKKFDKEYGEKAELTIGNDLISYSDEYSEIKFNPRLKKISYNNQVYKEKNKEYNVKISDLIKKLNYFEDSDWINFNLEKVIECIENSKK